MRAAVASPSEERSVLANTDQKTTRPGVIRTHDQGIMRTKAAFGLEPEKTVLSLVSPAYIVVSDKVGQSRDGGHSPTTCRSHLPFWVQAQTQIPSNISLKSLPRPVPQIGAAFPKESF
jgi:hypothetical protein